jgi:hypothetical protein
MAPKKKTRKAKKARTAGGWVSFSAGLVSVADHTDLRTNFAVKLGALGI